MNDLLTKAIVFSANAHEGQHRKVDQSPYILHPMEVATIVGSMTQDEALIAAALLHDTVEDTNTTMQDIMESFGERVASYVAIETENKREGLNPSDTWKIRKEETLAHLRQTEDNNVRILWLGDKLSNLRSMYRAYLSLGDDLFQHFNQKDKSEQEWYYKQVGMCLSPLQTTIAYREYMELVHKIFD